MRRQCVPIIGTVTALLCVLGSFQWGWAQGLPGGKWWRTPRAIQRLNLTDEEIAQLDEAFRDSRRKMIPLKAAVEAEQFELETLMEADTIDEKALTAQYHKLEMARVDLGTERFVFLVKVRKIVGRQRFEELVRFKKAMDQRRKNGPPGGAPKKKKPVD